MSGSGRATNDPASTSGTALAISFELASHVMATFIFLFLFFIVPAYTRFLDQQEMKLTAAYVMVFHHAHFVATYWSVIVVVYALAGSGLLFVGQYLIKPLQWLRLSFFVAYFSLLAGYFLLVNLAMLFVLIGQPVHL